MLEMLDFPLIKAKLFLFFEFCQMNIENYWDCCDVVEIGQDFLGVVYAMIFLNFLLISILDTVVDPTQIECKQTQFIFETIVTRNRNFLPNFASLGKNGFVSYYLILFQIISAAVPNAQFACPCFYSQH